MGGGGAKGSVVRACLEPRSRAGGASGWAGGAGGGWAGSSERKGEAWPRDRVGARDRAIMRGTTCPGGLLVPFSKLWVTSWLNVI